MGGGGEQSVQKKRISELNNNLIFKKILTLCKQRLIW